jgi:hypothetical protein
MNFQKSIVFYLITVLLIVFLPWEFFSPGRFEDLVKYKEYLSLGVRHEETIISSPFVFIFKEIVFQQWEFLVYDFVQDIDLTILIIVAVTTGCFFVATQKLNIDNRIALLLLCPLMIDFFNSQLRNSLAVSIFLLGFASKKNTVKYLFFFLSATFHLGVLLLVSTYFIVNFLKRFSNKFLNILSLVGFSLACAFGDKLFFFLLDDPRIDVYTSSVSGMSVIYFIWALSLLGFILFMKLRLTYANVTIDFAFVGSLLVVLAYFSGAYYGRYLAMYFVFILLTIGKPSIKNGIFWVMIFYSSYTFLMNFVL